MLRELSVNVCLGLNTIFEKVLGKSFGLQSSDQKEAINECYRAGLRVLNTFSGALDLNDKIVLDGGCGGGVLSMSYADNGCAEVWGIDIVKKNVDFAVEYSQSKGMKNVKFVHASLTEIPADDNYFDIVIMSDVFEHLDRSIISDVFSECYRVLKPGGKLFIEFPPWEGAFAGHVMGLIRVPWSHLLYSASTIKKILYKIDDSGRLAEDCWQQYESLNRITAKQFREIMEQIDFCVYAHKEKAIRDINLLKKLPFIGKYMISRVEVVFSKGDK